MSDIAANLQAVIARIEAATRQARRDPVSSGLPAGGAGRRYATQRAPFPVLCVAGQGRDDDLALDTLAMGMSHDLEAAVAEGATLVHIGNAIFGERKTHEN